MDDASRFSPTQLEHPIVQAPMGGGPSTPALAAAVTDAGGLGFLAAGYKQAESVRADIEDVRGRTGGPFGVNLFAPPAATGDRAQVERYAASLCDEAERYGAQPGEPRHDDDGWADKLALVAEQRVAVVSFTFGCPPADVVERLQGAGTAVWVTVTTVPEAVAAQRAGADALVVQG
ncbi:MAG: nitronate monooxygenase, partial [Actinomycetota bacterium]|nr:nitronate monooxygenase [Actinomycetota bacterium]